MIRIQGQPQLPQGGPPQLPIPEEPALPPVPEESALPQEDIPQAVSIKINPMVAVYKTPDMGPFMCGNCVHFDGANSCEIVEGEIDPNAVCNLFEPHEGEEMEAAVPEEVSIAEGEGGGLPV